MSKRTTYRPGPLGHRLRLRVASIRRKYGTTIILTSIMALGVILLMVTEHIPGLG